VLAERSRVQAIAIARLAKEAKLVKTTHELETKLLRSSLLQAKTNSKLLKAEKASLKQNVKATLLSALREIRKPLNRIAGGLKHIFSSSLEGPELMEELKYIAACAHHQKVLIKSAIDLDTFITGNKKFGTSAFNMVQLCRKAVAVQALSVRNGVDIVLASTALKDDENFVGSPSQLSLVLANLLSSAAKYTKKGKVELKLTVVGETYKYQAISFTVTDTGRPVSEEMQDIFFGSRGLRGYEGEQIRVFGFGIFVAHEFVKRMRGVLKLHTPAFVPPTEKFRFARGGGGGDGEGEERGSELSFQVRFLKAVPSSLAAGSKGGAEHAPNHEQEQKQEQEEEEEEEKEEEKDKRTEDRTEEELETELGEERDEASSSGSGSSERTSQAGESTDSRGEGEGQEAAKAPNFRLFGRSGSAKVMAVNHAVE